MFDRLHDARVRTATFEWLAEQVARHDDVLPRNLLAQGFELDGVRVPLLGPQGIFKPRILDVPLSITTAPHGPYNDSFDANSLLRYRYRGTDPEHVDNRGLRFAMKQRLPLVYFLGIVPGKYLAIWPVFVVGDAPERLVFTVEADDAHYIRQVLARQGQIDGQDDHEAARRAYITAAVRVRVHQRAFRERVLEAYRRQCAFCRLRHDELLDAAHIIPDADPGGEPHVRNGLALCSLHHKAFDRFFIGVRPDCTIEVREDLRQERDGPVLVHAIQNLHNRSILLPRKPSFRPGHELLEQRYEQFRRSAQ
jgi:putative restriction endonuclease